MKHSLVLLLGLTSLVLSSAPAYANHPPAPIDFDPSQLSSNRPHQLAQKSSDGSRLKQQDSASQTHQLDTHTEIHTDTRKQINQSAKGRDFDRSNSEELSPGDIVEDLSSRDRLPSNLPHMPDRSYQLETTESPPFRLREDLTDAELFEEEPTSTSVEPTLPSKSPSIELESSDAAFDQFFESLQSQPSSEPSSSINSIDQSIHPTNDSTFSTDRNFSRQHSAQAEVNSKSQLEARRVYQTDTQKSNARSSVSPQSSPGLDFSLSPHPSSLPQATVAPSPVLPQPVPPSPETTPKDNALDGLSKGELEKLFAGESDSLVAIAVGSAEGTRSPDGGKNPAYRGHVDPGNGVWNLGSFSYQHGANSPEEADAKQLARLRAQAKTIFDKASAKGLDLTLEEKLNGIDLANQAPKAALDEWGYIDRLAEAYARGLTGSDAILWARVQSFINPRTQTWDAPGLGNSQERITRDQERRMFAIADAIANYLQQIAHRSLPKSSDDQANRKDNIQQNGMAQLFTQKFMDLFASSSSDRESDQQAELPIVQQILSLNLSG
ncbi:hypothetical protein [Thermocoleostomius sinensis]|uniref:Secreted protein n=1 Tax=Thermocoleostomius sinensis A174 TaxID=2016057 RepID=A0A9E9C8L2_9CYAN|nr:hypothetical protein [Thermocoleostomius sinensis]WAL61534.1 hypothetical protein OXH18_05975 [Thermocoleostomius sinensis A174]